MNGGQLHAIAAGGIDTHYESIQPPLYYFCVAKLCDLFLLNKTIEEQGIFLRLFGVVIFLVTTVLLFFSYCNDEVEYQLGIPAAYAFSPILNAIFATVTNDSMAFLFSAGVLALTRLQSIPQYTRSFCIGLVCGLGLLTKLTFFPVVFVSLVLIVVRGFNYSPKRVAAELALFALPIVIFVTPLLLWNITTYGALSPYSTNAHYLVHGPLNCGSPQQVLIELKSFIAYHLVPTEFWLNQFRLSLFEQIIGCVLLLSAYGAAVFILTKASRTKIAPFYGSQFYLASILCWVAVICTTSIEPVRGFLLPYWGFCALQSYAMRGVAGMFRRMPFERSIRVILALLLPGIFLVANFCIIVYVMPILQNLDLRPE